MNGRLRFALAAALLFVHGRALADEPTPDQRARAQQLFEAAMADVERADFESACPKFRASHEVDPKASAVLNLAQCYEKLGKTASAWGAYKEAVVYAQKIQKEEWVQVALGRIAALEPKLITLTIVVPPPVVVEGLELRRDGAPLLRGEWGVPIPVDPGAHSVTASAPGKDTWTRQVFAIEGEDEAPLRITIPSLRATAAPTEPLGPVAAKPAPPPRAFWNTQRTIGVITGGAGVATIVVGSVLGLAANARYDHARSQCVAGLNRCPADAVDSANGAYDLAAASTVTFIVGGLVLAGGGILFLAATDEPKKNWIGVSPFGSPSQAGVGARGTW